MAFPLTTDVVFVNSLNVSANIGVDCWGKARAQPLLISVYLHLHNSQLTLAGESDDVRDSVHYGHLSKAILALTKDAKVVFEGVDELIDAVTREAFGLAGDAAASVRVVVDAPKQILLAGGFCVDVTTEAGKESLRSGRKVEVKDLVLAVVIGVNPPERKTKQRVVSNLVFYEREGAGGEADYAALVKQIANDIEKSEYLTLEKFVMQIVKAGCLSSEAIVGMTARAQKPSALSFAHSSGVEITRERKSFV